MVLFYINICQIRGERGSEPGGGGHRRARVSVQWPPGGRSVAGSAVLAGQGIAPSYRQHRQRQHRLHVWSSRSHLAAVGWRLSGNRALCQGRVQGPLGQSDRLVSPGSAATDTATVRPLGGALVIKGHAGRPSPTRTRPALKRHRRRR